MPESLIWGVNPAFQHTAARRRLVSAFNQPFLTGWFQHTAARRRLDGGDCSVKRGDDGFNTQPPEGGWPLCFAFSTMPKPFQHTAARRRLANYSNPALLLSKVSTHSRPKAAGPMRNINYFSFWRFNTQPPEGGWLTASNHTRFSCTFQHTAARRRLEPLSKALLHQVSQP